MTTPSIHPLRAPLPNRQSRRIEIPVHGMDCAECCRHVQQAIAAVPGVAGVEVFLASEKAVVEADPAQLDLEAVRRAVADAGYRVPDEPAGAQAAPRTDGAAPVFTAQEFTRPILTTLALALGAILLLVVVGEGMGLLDALTERVPWWIGGLLVLVGGYPVFRQVLRAARRGKIIAHTLMSLGVVAALAVGEWATAAIVVLLMRFGDYVERFTAERARRAVRDLAEMAPQTARVERPAPDGTTSEQPLPVAQVQLGEVVVVRPGEQIPVDGEVIGGQATVNQAAITGESMPVEAGPGATVYAATLVQLGHLRVRATRIGPDSTFGRVIKLVEEAEAHRADVQRVADRFSAYFLPFVAAIAALTFLISRNLLATAAVLVVACSCSLALATPIAMLASIGAAARRGLMIKGGKYLEALTQVDVLLIDKTGTLTLGRPQIDAVVALNGQPAESVLGLAAAAERYSEHPLAEAVRDAAQARGLALAAPSRFEALPGLGVRAQVNGHTVTVGNRRLLLPNGSDGPPALGPDVAALEQQGKTLIYVTEDDAPVGVLAAADAIRPEVPAAIAELRALGVKQIELLTGDNARTAAALAGRLGIAYRADLLPEDKVQIVRAYQAQGYRVAMVGDGVNDAPALAQADVGIAMGAAGSAIAVEAAHVALLRDDWRLVPELWRIARRTLRVVKLNIGFTAVYNLVGLSLAAVGLLPPVFAAAAQSLPDLGILANSSRLLRQK
ncbi:MAG TPA: cation-translocating P-type ATPase [Caldilineaceae bacterium]|nr:cation-translocating P-type ATPase [Caldilineaceae bacterium]